MSLDKIIGAMLEKNEMGLDVIDSALVQENQEWREPSPHFSVSQLFYCPRVAFLTRAGVPRKIDPVSNRKMVFGNLLHDKIQNALGSIVGYGYVEEVLNCPDLSVKGRIDGAIPSKGLLVEIKSMGASQSSKASKLGMPDYYEKQANLYIALWNMLKDQKLNGIWYIVLNRDSMEWVTIDIATENQEMQKETIKNLKKYAKMWERGELPPMKQSGCPNCSDFAMCKQITNLTDILVGGKVRVKYASG
jgi:CRISPR/Cas system-associated exonuclease Cas4 (RecB family)